MKPKGKGLIRSTTDATEEVVGSDEDFDEPIISALGKRDRFGDPNKRTDGKRDSSGEEAERPQKNRVSGMSLLAYSGRLDYQKTKATGQNNVSTKASSLGSKSFLGCHPFRRRPTRLPSLEDGRIGTDISTQTATRTPLSPVISMLCSLVLCLLVVIASRFSA